MQPSNIFANQRCAHDVLEPDGYKFLQSLRSALIIAAHKPQSAKKRNSNAAVERSFTIANLSGSGIRFDELQSGQSVNLTYSCKAS